MHSLTFLRDYLVHSGNFASVVLTSSANKFRAYISHSFLRIIYSDAILQFCNARTVL